MLIYDIKYSRRVVALYPTVKKYLIKTKSKKQMYILITSVTVFLW